MSWKVKFDKIAFVGLIISALFVSDIVLCFTFFLFSFYEILAPTDKEFFDVNKPNAFFICLVATDDYGKSAKEHYLYDVATEMELQGFRVKFLSAKDIKDFYLRHHPEYDNTMQDADVEIYEMTHFFIAINKGSSFFLDEVRFILGEELSRSKHVYSYTQMNWINIDMFLNIIMSDMNIIYG